jgi:peptidoglycan/LPS O-acetylase OafA/YrhL
VGLVLLYHLRPDKVSGGFVGVDVFLVISGFLIIGSLSREAARTGRISLSSFFARRARRLLPASALVLMATLGATLLLLPASRWQGTAEDVIASALQVQNWALALNSGYAAATVAVSPLQHYWSLAVEEQFYLVAPLLLLFACWVAARTNRPRAQLILVVVAVLAVASFVHSVDLSVRNHDVAYFATTTRMWELAAGGLLALLAPRLRLPAVVRSTATWVGLGAIGVSALTFTTSLAFPGWVALVPVLGSGLVLLGGLPEPTDPSARPGSGSRLLGMRPLTYLGDISYSLYLWHWPVIVFYAFYAQRLPSPVECAGLTLAAVGLAAISTRFVEQPFRAPRRKRARGDHRSAVVLAAALVSVNVAAAVGPWVYVDHLLAGLASQRLDADHPGAAEPLPAVLPAVGDVPVIPDPAVAVSDVPLAAVEQCVAFDPRTMGADACTFGDTEGRLEVVLAGDSHAGQFSTALAHIGQAQGWRLQTMVRNGCPFTAAPMLMSGSENADCASANVASRDRILALRPRTVVVSAMNPREYERALDWTWESEEALIAGYRNLWQPLVDAGIRVLVVRDTPIPDYVGPDCVAQHGPGNAECTMTRAEAIDAQSDPQVAAAGGMDGVEVLDLSDHFCNAETCPGVIGNVLVYRDNHITDTLSLSLVPVLADALRGVV